MLSVKNWVRRMIYSSAENKAVYSGLWHPLWRLTQLASRQHHWSQLQLGAAFAEAARPFRDHANVRSGPFEGLSYNDVAAIGSTYTPKLLGCYEQELHAEIERIIKSSPDTIIDIGSAEGYYAIGLAMRIPLARVIAYDTSAAAQDLCRSLAQHNGVATRVEVKSTCTVKDLMSVQGKRVVILSDCEGAEAQLFTHNVISSLAHAHIIIECHDFLRPFLTQQLRRRFATTHDIEIIYSIPDHLRPTIFPQPAISSLSRDIQLALMAETRPGFMNWLICKPHIK